uniref:B box-type domain-containing protein n=1 Tax=Magallana gigas TaxID=29159 RepID=A0A8W8J0X2_MAGGI|nr:uncharacterized protein LOC117684375 [Crassostrea gigas]
MALSNPEVSDSVQEEPIIGQDCLMCGTEGCEKNCLFYCNDCHLRLCEQCKNEHQKSLETQNHEVVPYPQRKRKLPVEKCKDHPTKDIDMLCEDCQVPVCSKCVIQNHRRHAFNDLETIYSKKYTLCLDEIHKINQYFLPSSLDIQEDIRENFKEIKASMDKIRTSIKAKAESLKRLVDTVASDEIKQVNKMEKSLKEKLKSQDKSYQDYISYLEDLVKQYHGYLSSTKVQSNPLILSQPDQLKIHPIPMTTKPIPPVFTAGQYSKEDVTKLLGRVTVPDTKPKYRKVKPLKPVHPVFTAGQYSKKDDIKLLGRVTVPDTKPEYREIKPMTTASTGLKPTEKQSKEDKEKSDEKQTLPLSSSATKVREYTVPDVNSVCHISLNKSERLWGSDSKGNLVQTDLQGNQLQKIQTSSEYGYHTVTRDGDLIYINKENKVIKITEFVKTGEWEPISIHSSPTNGDILMGMIKGREAKVTRYNKTGEEIQNIQRDNKGQGLYDYPHYITENINGDICTSDWNKRAVVVVNKSGQHRFSYPGQGSGFYPWGICTDILSHILVCNSLVLDFSKKSGTNTIHLLDQDGQFLFYLPIEQPDIKCPCSLCVDDENNVHLGQWTTDTVTVYKYLQ